MVKSEMKKIFKTIQTKLENSIIPFIISFLILLIIIAYLSQKIFYTILPGEAGVHWSRFHNGTEIDYVYPEGMHVIVPWDKLYIYNVRLCSI